MPTVTVMITAHPGRIHNGMLDEALRSVQQQTRLPDAINIAVDLHGEGAPATKQRALETVTTEFVQILDSDDLLLPKHLEWVLAHQAKTGADFVYSWFKVLQHFADGTRRILEDDPVFPVTHYLNEFDPNDPVETTTTVLVRTDLARKVGFKALDRGEVNTGEDRYFTLGCLAEGAHISHLVRKSWLWRHHQMAPEVVGNTSGHATRGDARLTR